MHFLNNCFSQGETHVATTVFRAPIGFRRRRSNGVQMKKSRFFVFALSLFSAQAYAGVLDPRELITMFESSLVDMDVSTIAWNRTIDVNRFTTGAFSYSSLVTDSGWQGKLTGQYDGLDVEIDYGGTLSYIGGPTNDYAITYHSDWLIGGITAAGSGTALYQDPVFTFSVSSNGTVTSADAGWDLGIVSLTIGGEKDLSAEKLRAYAELAILKIPKTNWSLFSSRATYELDQRTRNYVSSTDVAVAHDRTSGRGLLYQSHVFNEGRFFSDSSKPGTMTITATGSVPGPASAASMVVGFTSMTIRRRKALSRTRNAVVR